MSGGQGFATEAAAAIVRFGFEDLGLHCIWAECNAENTGSVRVLTKLGMQREARFRDHKWFGDRWWDTEIYAMLEDEWRGAVVGCREASDFRHLQPSPTASLCNAGRGEECPPCRC
ncbi:MAG: GNAT family protein [Thermomicrobiales bacterium]